MTIQNSRGFTLVELALVVAILSVVSLMAVSRVSRVAERSRIVAAENDLRCLRDAFVNEESGYVRDMRGIPGFSVGYLRVANLLVCSNLYGAVEQETYRTLACRVDDPQNPITEGCARPETFWRWSSETERGWRGPYYKGVVEDFPQRHERRSATDATAAERGFYPVLTGLRLPTDFLLGKDGCSVYGFPGEPAAMDPWNNPYVLQIPPPQAFWDKYDSNTNLPDEVRFAYARVVSAGPNGRLETPCYDENRTNDWGVTVWDERMCRRARQAGRYGDELNRGDDLVLFLLRNDVDEGRVDR